MTINNSKEILTLNEVAEYLQVNPITVYSLTQLGKIPASKVLGCWRYKRGEIEAWLKAQEFKPAKILVIDDDPFTGCIIKEAFEEKHTVISVENGRDALSALESEPYDLIFIDLNLPDIDGLSLYKLIKSQERKIPVVVITVSTDIVILTKMLSEGAQFVLNKPFTFDEARLMLNFLKTG